MNLQRLTQTITIAGKIYDAAAILASDVAFNSTAYGAQLLSFLQDWFSPAEDICVSTSGSMGAPKKIHVEKDRMMQSARLTCQFLGLQPGDTTLLCMPLEFIGGKMMVVRALVAGLDLHFVSPCARPLEHTAQHFIFSAMVPMQVYDSLHHEGERERLMAIKHLIIGGGSIDEEMGKTLKTFPHAVYSTYGMTETLSHIAVRKLSGSDVSELYHPFESVSLSLAQPDGTLVIHAPLVAKEPIYTHDVAQIDEDGSFRILGRKDNVINSGGIKIQAEEVEALLKPV
ncbi:MAG: AMP-binding protein, partial [Saezia sp.]